MTVRSGQLDWLLVEFVRDTPGVANAIVVSGDGLRLATSPGVTVALGDQLAAAASGLVSLARGTAHLLGAGAVSQTIVEMAGGYLFVSSVNQRGRRSRCTPSAGATSGLVGYEMTMLASRVGHALSPAPRTNVGS